MNDFKIEKLITRNGFIQTNEFNPKDVSKIVNGTYIRRAIKHPFGYINRLYYKFRASPVKTISFVLKYTIKGIAHLFFARRKSIQLHKG